ncbi:MAG: MDR family MFS transporter [Fidelibacterota bacterium]
MMNNKLSRYLFSFDRRLWVLMLGWFISSLGFGAVVPFVSIYFHTELGVPMSLIGSFFLVAAVLRSSSQIIGGELSDRIGRRRLLIISQANRAAVFIATGVAIAFQAGFWVIAGILMLNYLLSSYFQPVASAMIVDLVPKEKRVEGYSVLRTAGNAGWGTGPAIGGFLAYYGYEYLFYFCGISALISGILIWTFVGETFRKSENSSSESFMASFSVLKNNPTFNVFMISALLLFLTMGQLVSTLSVYMSKTLEFSSRSIGWVYTYNALLVILFQIPVSRMIRKINMFKLMIISSFLYFIAYALMGWVHTYPLILLMITIITSGEIIGIPTGNTIVSYMSPEGKHGRYQGIYSLATTLGWSVGPFIGGVSMDLLPDPKVLWFVLSLFSFMAVWGFLWLKHHEKACCGSSEPL